MSWHYLQAGEAVSSEDSSLDGTQFAPSRLKATREKYCSRDSLTESFHSSRYGTILELLTVDHGVEPLILLPGGFLVRTFRQREKVLESMGNGPGSGEKWPGWFAKYDLNLCSWKTAQCSLFGESIEFSETWPRWGIMRDGVCWEQTPPERLTKGKGSGFWPTPTKSDGNGPGIHGQGGMDLRTAVKMWPTPTLCGNHNRKGASKTSGDGLATKVKKYPTQTARDWKSGKASEKTMNKNSQPLSEVVVSGGKSTRQTYPTPTNSMMTWADMEQAKYSGNDPKRPTYQEVKYPTPQARDYRTGQRSRWEDKKRSRNLNDHQATEQTGKLNPEWVAWLMGVPIGYTDLKPLGMHKFRQWWRLHSLFYPKGC